MKLESRIRQLESSTLEPHDSDFELVDCSNEPLFKLANFLESRKLGAAGRNLLQSLGGHEALTKSQEELLVKICQKMGHEDWPEAIQQEMASTIQALEAVDEECSHSALNMV